MPTLTADYLHTQTSTSDNGESLRTIYLVCGSNDPSDACAMVRDQAVSDFPGWSLSSVDYQEAIGAFACKVSADFIRTAGGISISTADKKYSFSVNCSGHSVKSKKSVANVWKSSGAPDHDFVGYDPETGEYRGADIDIPDETVSWTVQMPLSQINTSYRRKLRAIYGKVNSSRFQGYEPGELRFIGYNVSFSSTDYNASITYNFKTGINETNVPFRDGITIPRVGAHDFVWWYTINQLDGSQSGGVINQDCVYVEKMFESANFSIIKI